MNDEQAPAELEGIQATMATGESPAPEPAAQGLQPVNISCTRGFPDWLLRNNVSLAFTSYQTGRLYLVGVNSTGQTAFHERFFARVGRPAAAFKSPISARATSSSGSSSKAA
jgi:hypothetical protein